MTSQPLYMKPHTKCRATYTLYKRHHSHYPCPHTHCIVNITPIHCMTSHSPYVWHRLHYTRHHILNLWTQTTVLWHHTHYIWYPVHCICVITFTVLVISHQLYSWDHICYISRHHIHCIWHGSHCMTSQLLHSWYQIPYIWHHLQGLWHLVPYTCNITDTILWIHVNSI